MLGAEKVYGIDTDIDAIEVAEKNEPMPKTIHWEAADISEFHTRVDTVVMNPPFGIKKPHADRPFLEKALEVADTIYTIHDSNEPTRSFINTFVKSLGGTATVFSSPLFELPMTYRHHRKDLERIKIDLYRIEKNETHQN